LRAGDELAGRRVKCPDCGAVLLVPKPESGSDAEEIRLLPLNDPWAEAPPRGEESQPKAAEDEVIGEVLPVDADEEEEDEDDDEVSQREWVRRREAREADHEAERDRNERKKRRREEYHRKLAEVGRARIYGTRRSQLFGPKGSYGTVYAGIGGGAVIIVVGLLCAGFMTMFSGATGHAAFFIPVGALVIGIVAIIKGVMDYNNKE